MSLRTAFGYEKENGKVVYVLCQELSFDIIYKKYLVNRSVPDVGVNTESLTVEMYFRKENFANDLTTWRILYKLDGDIVCQRDGDYEVLVRRL